MPVLHLILVALVQGITEFLPISSSGHLILLPALTGLQDQGQVIDVAVHVGTLGAVMLYFRRETASLFRGLPKVARRQIEDQDSWLALCLVIATIPIVLIGLVINLTGLSLPVLLSGSLVIEVVFAWPGMGRLTYDAIRAHDVSVVLASTLLVTLLVVAGNLGADLAMAAADPRIRLTGRRSGA